jgi:signal transduction histidine kinase
MDLKGQHTDFASTNRSSAFQIKRQSEYFVEDGIFSSFLNIVPTFLLVLNKNKQIVYANEAVKKLFPGDPFENNYGKHPGEFLNCSYFGESNSCSGTSRFCTRCGAIKSILASLSGEENKEEARIIQAEDDSALDLRVWSKPLKINNEIFSIFAFTDISDEKRREALERIFFHDIINTADTILKLSELIKEADGEELVVYNDIISTFTYKLIDEIKSQRDLLSAENNELIVNQEACNSLEIISEVIALYSNYQVVKEKEIIIDRKSENITFISDKVLLKRVLGNMIKNALESSNDGNNITAGTRFNDNKIEFYIHNTEIIPDEIQIQIFQRFFTTKGAGRGLGTYSMKLLSEKYLGGQVLFESIEGKGTTFYARFPLQI